MNKVLVINSTKVNQLFAFLIGFLAANNIIYAFKVSNTTIKAITVIAAIGIIYYAGSKGGKVKNPFYIMPQSLTYGIIAIFLSIIPVLIFNIDIVYQWFVGIIAFILMCSVGYLTILLYDEYKSSIFNGLFWGVIANVVLILWGLYSHSRGIAFTLAELFPQESIAPVHLTTSYRGSGLFREPGHLMRYMAILGLPIIYYYSNNKRKMIIATIGMIVILAYTRSSAAVVFGVEIVLLVLINSSNDTKSFWRAFLIVIAIVVAASAITPIRSFIINEVFSGFVDFTTYREQTTRLTGMQSAIKVMQQYPIIGTGWNTLSMIFYKNGYNIFISNGFGGGEYVSAAFSEGLTIAAELGVFSIFYYVFVITTVIHLIRRKDKLSVSYGVSLIGYFMLFFMTDFQFILNACVPVLIGLSIGRLNEMRLGS